MLGKQAWRISQQPSSLLSQLMKGLYYPQGDFWQAGKGSRPSWGWQSIVLGRDSITPQVMWAVGNGQSILIREDKWLRSGIIGGPAARNEPHKVEALIEHRDGKWKESMLRTMFDDQRVKEILETPIGLPSTADKRVWMSNKSGDYSVKSGYIHIRNQTANTPSTQQHPPLIKQSQTSGNLFGNRILFLALNSFYGMLARMHFLQWKTCTRGELYLILYAQSVRKKLRPLNMRSCYVLGLSSYGEPVPCK